jgi:predicted nuclease of predicted toxin-antitoxin system
LLHPREPAVKFKIDENLPRDWVNRLRAAGHDALSVVDQNLSGHSDEDAAHICAHEGRAIVSLDTDFANILRYPPSRFAGMIVIRIADQSIPSLSQLLDPLLLALEREPVSCRLWIVEKDRIRIRGG